MPVVDNRIADRPPLADTLAVNVAAVANGTWKPLGRVHPITVSVESDPATPFLGAADLIATLRRGTLADTDHAGVVLTTFAGPGTFLIDGSWEAVKLRVRAYTSGTITHAGLSAA